MIADCNEGDGSMEDFEIAYNGEFTVEERKAMTAQVIQELRKSKKMSQKEVAGYLNIPATTYNTYESGRTEPPIEILVRLSHLYGITVDFIVQRDRTYRTADDISRQIDEYQKQLAELDRQLAENGGENDVMSSLIATLGSFTDAMKQFAQTEAAQKSLKDPAKD
jgi:transcriptional regulator with XRE-family HTH domain